MKQLAQKLKNGKMQILEVAIPTIQPGHLLVRNHYSLISAGTEASTVSAARKGYIGKARERPQQVRQVLDTLKTQGITQTYRAVMKKLDAYSPLGYSCAGSVVGATAGVKGFKVGDLVACGGNSACHSEIVSVPINLCVKLDPDADLKYAAFNTLGAIALQGVRQAALRLGETAAVIGLGLLGQLTALFLKASGVRVVGLDIDQSAVQKADQHCLDLALNRNDLRVEDKILQFTGGLGCDAVIITAASSSLDPINFAGGISRKKGTVVVVGAVPTGFDREPHFYKKELQIKMSCSYGPGRYDPIYEDKGIDYPPAYVRWTENRNMQAFQSLIAAGKIDLSSMITHTFNLDEAPSAYEMLLEKTEPFLGVLIEYDLAQDKDPLETKIFVRSSASKACTGGVSIGFIGAGSYAQSQLLPYIPKHDNVALKGVMTLNSSTSRSVAERFGFEFCTGNADDIVVNEKINTLFIASRHDSHAEYVCQALAAGKHVFVEKPLCMTTDELERISDLLVQTGESKAQSGLLMVGYNRRFAPLVQKIKDSFSDGLMAMTYRINAGVISPDSWIQDLETGGGRIIGEVCHFVDLLTFINGSIPHSVYATGMKDPHNLSDTLNISLSYLNGSIGTISYFANGDKSLPKERLEIYSGGCVFVLDDFKCLTRHAHGKKKVFKLMGQDKGQKNEMRAFIDAVQSGKEPLIPIHEIYSASLVTFKIVESILTGQVVKI